MQWISSEIKLKKHHCTRLNPKPYSGIYYISGANTNNNRKYGDPDTSVPSEALVSLFDSYKSLVPIKSLHFFLRTLLLSTFYSPSKANTFDTHIF